MCNQKNYCDNNLKDKIISELKNIYDPEIPVDIYELGLIYDIQILHENNVKIIMTLTNPNCPVIDSLPIEIEQKIKSIKKIKNVKIIITFDPPWCKEFMSEEARLELGML
ncbi:iron-sulfur cluster assembly protein [Blattabacterium cuenoti]|uniref:iron-sulfur cluster assembly protein n=1 Tax=Blattabacterium cuenoti TaxID=1653831 RepID=UPI00163CBC4F|nr:iron-sulfur cluster assembly protein [Blattabacterium cuenoti]